MARSTTTSGTLTVTSDGRQCGTDVDTVAITVTPVNERPESRYEFWLDGRPRIDRSHYVR